MNATTKAVTLSNLDDRNDLSGLEEMQGKQASTQFLIPTANAQALRIRLEKANRRARKCLVNSGLRDKNDKSPVLDLEIMGLADKLDEEGNTVVCFVVQISGDLPSMESDEFVARVEHVFEEGKWENIIHRVPGKSEEQDLRFYRHAAPCCEHCHTERRRNDTFVLRSKGKLVQVGRNCLGDYLGGMSWHMFEELADVLIEISEACEESEESDGLFEWGYRSSRMMSMEEYLNWVSLSIRNHGWISRTKAREEYNLISSADDAVNLLNEFRRGISKDSPEAKDQARVSEALNWVRTLTDEEINASKGDYLYNLRTICKSNFLRFQHTGIAGSLLIAYDKAMQRVAEKKQTRPSNYVGKVNERIEVKVKVHRMTPKEGYYGMTYIYQMIDEQTGNRFTWFSSNNILDVDQTYTLKGTVKNHEEYETVKRTILTRCTVLK